MLNIKTLKFSFFSKYYSSKCKIICFSQTKKNDKYFKSRLTPDKIDKIRANEAENIIYSESLRLADVNFYTLISFLIGTIYWYLVPDVIKFILLKLVLAPVYVSYSFLSKHWILFNVSLDSFFNNKKIPLSVLFHRICKIDGTIKLKNYRMQILLANKLESLYNLFQISKNDQEFYY